MKRSLLTLLIAVIFCPAAKAQGCDTSQVLLTLRGGAGLGVYRDMGASPITYRGLEIHPGIGVLVEQPQWRYEALFEVGGGAYGYRPWPDYWHCYGGQAALSFEMLRRVASAGQRGLQLWLGASVDERFDLRYNGNLGNACTGTSNFIRINAIGRAEYRLERWQFWGRLELNPVALLLRPGYAYIDNYDRDIARVAANLFDQHHWYLAGGTGLGTEVGAQLTLANGNRLGLSYRWRYLNSRATADGVTAPFRFEQAEHALLFNLSFNLR